MPEILIALISGIVLLLFSTKTLIKLSETLSLSLKLSPLIIGMTVVAIGTSLPELSVSTIASLQHDYGLAVGNIIGSNIVNILLVFSVGILIGNLRIGTTKTPRNAIILLLFTFIYTYTHLFTNFPRQTLGLFFITTSFLVTFLEYKWALFGRTHEDNKKFKNSKRVRFTLGKLILLIMSVAGIITGGYFIVTSTEKLSLITGLSTGVLGLTLTAVATSLPELLTTIFSQEEHEEKMTIGNIIGSNIYNLFLIGGIIDLFSGNTNLIQINWLTLNLTTVFLVLIIFIFRGKTIPKWIGLTSLLLFFMYILYETKNLSLN
ncbi:MAG: sodium:calcium antiporter [Candidatus Woesebacteria bacterium]|nr:MAG: sodium:calcium antiporter [Candidatus Woesebacteria bacterium]